jgi:hypothetical protein
VKAEVEEERLDPDEPEHMKFTVGVVNWGGPRRKGEDRYAKNLFNLPVFIAMTMEMDDIHVRQVEEPRLEWVKASSPLAVDTPRQGYDTDISCAGGRRFVRKWRASEIYLGLAVVGRCSRVKSYSYPDRWSIEWKGGQSRLLAVEVTWQQNIADAGNFLSPSGICTMSWPRARRKSCASSGIS